VASGLALNRAMLCLSLTTMALLLLLLEPQIGSMSGA
jgi:hypothetical protein